MSAKIGANPSYIWRSLLEAQNLIIQGVSCRVGNGEDIQILNTRWLPLVSYPFIHSNSESLINQKVVSLMHIGEKKWDLDVIHDIFEDRDVELILSIELGGNNKDTWYWRFEKMGHYSVKSAYIRLQENKGDHSTVDNSGFWRKLWQLKLPSKVKNFLWRVVSRLLPTKDLLRVRNVDTNVVCPICQVENESIEHILVNCSFADHCHQLSSPSLIQEGTNSFAEWLSCVFENHDKNAVHVSVVVCWLLWKNRNDAIWKQRSVDSSELVNSAFSILNQWRSVQDKNFDHFLAFVNPEDGVEQWHKPENNSVKINTDAALFEEPNRYSYAFVTRDHFGSLVEASSKCKLGRVSPEFAKAVSIREALSWLKNKVFANAVLESDCLQVVQLIRSSYSSLSYLGKVITNCRALLSGLQSQNVKLKFVRRSANRVAHYLARYSCSIADRSWKVGDVHPDRKSVV